MLELVHKILYNWQLFSSYTIFKFHIRELLQSYAMAVSSPIGHHIPPMWLLRASITRMNSYVLVSQYTTLSISEKFVFILRHTCLFIGCASPFSFVYLVSIYSPISDELQIKAMKKSRSTQHSGNCQLVTFLIFLGTVFIPKQSTSC